MNIYLRVLGAFYALGALLHLMDVLGLRLNFTELNLTWKIWIIYLLVFDTVAAFGLWRLKSWGVMIFIIVALSQLIAYTGFKYIFGNQTFLIVFHASTLAIFCILYIQQKVRRTR